MSKIKKLHDKRAKLVGEYDLALYVDKDIERARRIRQQIDELNKELEKYHAKK